MIHEFGVLGSRGDAQFLQPDGSWDSDPAKRTDTVRGRLVVIVRSAHEVVNIGEALPQDPGKMMSPSGRIIADMDLYCLDCASAAGWELVQRFKDGDKVTYLVRKAV